MMDYGSIEIIGLIIVCFLMVIILLRILYYVHQQASQVDEIKRQIELMNKKEKKKNG